MNRNLNKLILYSACNQFLEFIFVRNEGKRNEGNTILWSLDVF